MVVFHRTVFLKKKIQYFLRKSVFGLGGWKQTYLLRVGVFQRRKWIQSWNVRIGGVMDPGASDLHPSSREIMESVRPRGHKISFQCAVGGIHWSKTVPFESGSSIRFWPKQTGRERTRMHKFNCSLSMKCWKDEDMQEMWKSFGKWLARKWFKFWKTYEISSTLYLWIREPTAFLDLKKFTYFHVVVVLQNEFKPWRWHVGSSTEIATIKWYALFLSTE